MLAIRTAFCLLIFAGRAIALAITIVIIAGALSFNEVEGRKHENENKKILRKITDASWFLLQIIYYTKAHVLMKYLKISRVFYRKKRPMHVFSWGAIQGGLWQ